MESLANDLFLLIASLSSLRNKERIISLFLNGLNSFLPGYNFSWQESCTTNTALCVSTQNKCYGELLTTNQLNSDQLNLPLVQNAIQMLAVIFERLEQEELLNNQTHHLQNLVDERTVELKEQIEETQQLNEELNDSLLHIQQINTKLKEAKEKAEESDRLKTDFIHNLSHEIRTPMNAIMGFTSLLNDESLTPDKRKHFSYIIQSSGDQLLRIIDDILEISHLESQSIPIKKEEISINNLLLKLFNVFEPKVSGQKIRLYLKKGLTDDESKFITDSERLSKVLYNLIENAVKFTHDGFVELETQLHNNHLEIHIKDTGIGIHPSQHIKIFERFSQIESGSIRNFGGLGLGLAIAKGNIELLGGRITLQSELKRGSTFKVLLPYTNENHQYKPTNSNQQHSTILVAEDEEMNYLYIEELLETTHPNVKLLHAKNGEEVLEFCHTQASIDLILMDIKMPVMNGYKATTEIKKIFPDLNIIALTAYSTNKDKQKAYDAGCIDFLSKPINKNRLKQMINKYLP